MFTEPPDLDRAALAEALTQHWRITPDRLDYLPVGFGSHHWEAIEANGARWFVTADDLERRPGREPREVFSSLDRAFSTAVALRDLAELEFVLAPITFAGASPLCRVTHRYAIHVEPFVDGTAGTDGEFAHSHERRDVAELVGRLHLGSAQLPAEIAGREDFTLFGRSELEAALGKPNERWDPGPFAGPARELLHHRAGDVRERLLGYDRITARARARADHRTWVVTHGEPHSANVIRGQSGGLWLVDWDTVLVGPPERDLWMVLDANMTGLDEYRAVTHAGRPDDELLGLYRERWALAEICEYVELFNRPHTDNADTREAWREFVSVLGE